MLRSVATGGVSEQLRKFVSEAPYERQPIFEFVAAAAQATAPGARVLGIGTEPYRELFQHTEYTGDAWENATDRSFDVVLGAQVLGQVPEPVGVLRDWDRVLVEGGRLFLTVPLLGELHDLPHDRYRFTRSGLAHLLEQAGFADLEIEPLNDCFATIAQLLLNASWAMGRQADGSDDRREEASALLEELAQQVARLGPLDTRWELPLGLTATAVKPG